MTEMEAVVLAGGRGSRLQPLTDNVPKSLVRIQGRPIIEILLKQLRRCGVTKVHLAVGHMAEQFQAQLGDGARLGLELQFSREDKPLSTAGPLKLIERLPENFIVANGDILTDLEAGEMFQDHLRSRAALTVAVCRRSDQTDYGVISIDDTGQIIDFEEKPKRDLTVSMGIYVFSRSVLEVIPDNMAFGFDDLMTELLRRKMSVRAWLWDGYWMDIGRPVDYLKANEDADRISHLLE